MKGKRYVPRAQYTDQRTVHSFIEGWRFARHGMSGAEVRQGVVAMQIDEVPENAMPPREADEPAAPVRNVPAIDPPVH